MPATERIDSFYFSGGNEDDRLAVVLIHGAGGNHLFWPSAIRRLAGYRIYAPDLPGHGRSTGKGLQSVGAYVDSLLSWLEEVSIYRAVFVGHSMGAAIALKLAIELPEHVLGLGLIGASARLRVSPELLESAANPTTFTNAIDKIMAWSYSPQAPPRLAENARAQMLKTRPSVLHGDFLACHGFDETDNVAAIRCPTLVICGEDDRMTPPRSAQSLANAIPSARLALIPAAGHMVMIEKPQVVADLLAGFFQEIAR